MSRAKHLISVIIPVYNGERYLAETLDSIRAQTYRPIEVIVTDGGSIDGSAAIVQGYPFVRYDFRPDDGAAWGRNRGVELAQGKLFSFLEADDLWTEDKLARQMAVLEDNPHIEAVFGHGEQFHSPEIANSLHATVFRLAKPVPAYHPNTMLIWRDAFFRIGLFDTRWRIADSVEWCVRAHEGRLKSIMLPDIVYRKRIHAMNQGLTRRDHRAEYVRVLKAALDRRRQSGPGESPS